MKLNEIDFNLLSDRELIGVCLKYKLIEKEQITSSSRKELLQLIKVFLSNKLKNYGHKKDSNVKVNINNSFEECLDFIKKFKTLKTE